MKPTLTQQDKAYAAGTPAQRHLYASSEAGVSLLAMAAKFNLSEPAQYKKFAIAVGDIVLGFYAVADTSLLMQHELRLNAASADLLAADVKLFLAPLGDASWTPPLQIPEDGQNNEAVANKVTSIEEELAAVEESIAKLPAFRTMAPIIPTEETVYTSTQAAILHEGRVNNTATPAQTAPSAPRPPSSPRWDTEA